jgi:hypothetical protein
MQMIDVLKRLAELDASNPNVIDTNLKTVDPVQNIVVKESAQVDECGIMPEMGLGAMAPSHPPMPASINMTAGSGEELSDMLTTIMTLAGMQKHDAAPATEPHGEAPPPAVATTDGEQMRSVIDKLNPSDDEQGEEDDQEETDEEYDNTPNDATDDVDEFDPDQHAHQENQPGQGDRMDGDKPKAYPTMEAAVEDLFAQYKKFVSEA